MHLVPAPAMPDFLPTSLGCLKRRRKRRQQPRPRWAGFLVPLDLEATFDQRLLRSVEQDTQQPDLKIAAVVPLVPFLFINEKETRTRGKRKSGT